VSPTEFLAYWLKKDSRLSAPLQHQLAAIRSRGTQVYLATNQEHVRAAYLMNELRLAETVDGIFYSARLGAKKPDADFFFKVQAATGLAGEEILLIDDSLPNVVAAQKAGWRALHWTSDSSPSLLSNL
jgi:putative hydrolase of the HAD superfamily